MATLFDEIEFNPKKNTELKIVPKGKEVLSKEQQEFNRLTKSIQKSEQDIILKEEALNRMLEYHGKTVALQEREHCRILVDFCKEIDVKTTEFKLSKKTKEMVTEIIEEFLDEAFVHLEVTDDLEKLHKKWCENEPQEVSAFEKGMTNRMFASMFADMFGVDIDVDFNDFDPTDPEQVRKIEEQLRSKFEEQKATTKTKKKTKRQLEIENKQKAEEELKSKNIRSVYISLSKLLHPDFETDEDLKQQKEEVMKQVTAAYENKDLSTLLRLELEWGLKTHENLTELSEQKLKIFIQVLKERRQELNHELRMLYVHPRFQPIAEVSFRSEKGALNELTKQAKAIELNNRMTEKNKNIFSTLNSKKEISAFISELYDSVFDDYDFW